MENKINDLEKTQYLPVCFDGHGALSNWVDTYDEANQIGKKHEYNTHGHRWDILTRVVKIDTEEVDKSSGMGLTANCRGNACSDINYSYYSGQNHWKNNSTTRTVEIKISNSMASESFKLGPGQEKASFLQQFYDPYDANYVA